MASSASSKDEKADQKRIALLQSRLDMEATATPLNLHATHRKPIVKATDTGHKACRRNFILFLHLKHPEMPEFNILYTYGSPLPTAALFKEFLLFYVQSSKGVVDTVTGKVTVWTVMSIFRSTQGMFGRLTGNSTEKPVARSVVAFILGDLQQHQGLSMTKKVKPHFDKYDLDNLLPVLFERKNLGTFDNMRTVLNLCLFIGLYIDCVSRGSDLAYKSSVSDGMDECLLWEDVEVFIFPAEVGVEVRAKVTIKGMKGMRKRPDMWKTVPLHVLSPHLALQDSLRLLLVLGFIDDVFVGVKDWAALNSLRPRVKKDGSRIGIKPSASKLPIFRRMDPVTRKINDRPLPKDSLATEVARVGEMVGFEKRLTPYAVRRGMGYKLDAVCGKEIRESAMGHTPGSRAWSAYESRVLTVDTANVFRGDRQISSLPLMRMSLNRSEGGRQPLSVDGYNEVLADPALIALDREVQQLRSEMLVGDKSIAEATRENHPLAGQHKGRARAYSHLRDVLIKKATEKERVARAEMDFLSVEPSAAEASDRSKGKQRLASPDGRSLPELRSGQPGGPSEEDVDDAFDILDRIDPLLLADDDGAPQHLPTDSALPDHLDQAYRRHSLQVRIATGPPSVTEYGHHRTFVGTGTCQDLWETLVERRHSDEELSAIMTQAFNVRHAVDFFEPGEEPTNGTLDCRFCGVDMCTSRKGGTHAGYYEHAHKCAAAHAQNIYLETFYPIDGACGWEDECGFVASDHVELSKHLDDHIVGDHVAGKRHRRCRFGRCASSPDRFASIGLLDEHLRDVHRLGREAPRPRYCHFCQNWLVEPDPDEIDAHFRTHEEEALELVREIGYEGSLYGSRMLRPRLCIFCLHDESLPFTARLTAGTSQQRATWFGHVRKMHLKKGESKLRRCPGWPTTCALDRELSTDQLVEHLSAVHRIHSSDGKSRKRPSDLIGDADASSSHELPNKKTPNVLMSKDGNARPTSVGEKEVA